MTSIPPGIYKNEVRGTFRPGSELPKISTKLDSVRAYQFEVRFYGLLAQGVTAYTDLVAAAKQVSPVGGQIEDIVVDRVNDKVFYPGKFTPETVQITFDNQLLSQATPSLWRWFKSMYDPITGEVTKVADPAGTPITPFKAQRMTIVELDNTNTPHAYVEMYGVYPTATRFSEKNYSTNEFSTLEVTFRYDFVDYGKYQDLGLAGPGF